MTPTNKLRWVKRKVKNLPPEFNVFSGHPMETVLQQWWAIERNGQITPDGQWLDIPVETEEQK